MKLSLRGDLQVVMSTFLFCGRRVTDGPLIASFACLPESVLDRERGFLVLRPHVIALPFGVYIRAPDF